MNLTLHPAFRVTDLAASVPFYGALGYQELGRVETGGATLVMLKLPGEEFVSLELVHRPDHGPVEVGTGFSHLAFQVDDLAGKLAELSEAGLHPGEIERPGGPDGPQTAWLRDPDGYHLELVQWPPDHPAPGLTAADFA